MRLGLTPNPALEETKPAGAPAVTFVFERTADGGRKATISFPFEAYGAPYSGTPGHHTGVTVAQHAIQAAADFMTKRGEIT